MNDTAQAKTSTFTIAWISVIVIFIGTVMYPTFFERASRMHDRAPAYVIEIQEPAPVTVPTMPVEEPVVIETTEHSYIFTRNLTMGDRGEDVKRLQEYLNHRGFIIAESGPGSPGQESDLFGKGTKDALIKFQEAYADILLKPYGLATGTGYFGEATRNFVNS